MCEEIRGELQCLDKDGDSYLECTPIVSKLDFGLSVVCFFWSLCSEDWSSCCRPGGQDERDV